MKFLFGFMHMSSASLRGGPPGIPGEIKVHGLHSWGKFGDFVFGVFHETMETQWG